MIATPASSCPARTVPSSLASASCCRTSIAGSARCEDAALSSNPRRLVTAERRDDDADGSLRPQRLGKTTLAQIVARELGVNFRATSGPVIAKAGDLAALLTNLEERDVLFI